MGYCASAARVGRAEGYCKCVVSRENATIFKMNGERKFKKQIVAGFVVYRRTHEGTKYLLLYRRGNYWNFPKGHFELGERGLDNALRETEEETGLKRLDLRIIPGFR